MENHDNESKQNRRGANRSASEWRYPDMEEAGRRARIRRRKELKRKRARARRRRRLLLLAGIALIILIAVIGLITLIAKAFHHFSDSESISDTEIQTEIQAESSNTAANQKPEESVDLVMTGDLLLHADIEKLSLQEDDTYDYTSLFAHVKDQITDADLALVNDEVIIGGKKLEVSGYPRFNAPYELADSIVDTGFDVVLYANNHANDKGKKAILNCINNWTEKYPDTAVLGIHDSKDDAQQIYVCEKNGIRIAILNYTELLNQSVSDKYSYLVDRLQDESKIRSDIQKAHEMADFVIVCPHWGTEYSNEIDEKQKKWTQVFLEEGVDLVIGSHPHVIQKVEMKEDTTTGHQMLVYYSLGNFCSWISDKGTEVQKREIGGLAEVTIARQSDGTVGIWDYSIEPLICSITKDKSSITVYPYQDYTEDLAADTLAEKLTGDFTMTYIDNYCDSIWGSLWRQN